MGAGQCKMDKSAMQILLSTGVLAESMSRQTARLVMQRTSRPSDDVTQSNSIQIFHKKRFSLRLFIHQRFLYSRYYAGLRMFRSTLVARLLMSILALGLPALDLLRIGRNLMTKKRLIPQFTRALPYLIVFVVIWGHRTWQCVVSGHATRWSATHPAMAGSPQCVTLSVAS
jgi:hypothetical protein